MEKLPLPGGQVCELRGVVGRRTQCLPSWAALGPSVTAGCPQDRERVLGRGQHCRLSPRPSPPQPGAHVSSAATAGPETPREGLPCCHRPAHVSAATCGLESA